jgi:NADPH2:quinone reductase
MKTIRVSDNGGPEVLALADATVPEPGPGEVLVKIGAAGVNFIDVYQRTGRYPVPLPYTPGLEGAGTVEALGWEVTDIKVGDRVAWASHLGSYAQYVAAKADKLVLVPKGIDDCSAAAAMLQGMTAHYLAHSTYQIKSGDTVLVHAAAGGVGLLLIQMAKRLGARVIGTVSTEEKARIARDAGADEVILYTGADFEAETRRLTGGEGVEVVYDSVGKDTFEKGLNCLKPLGYLVLYGGSSGPVPPIDPMVLSAKGSLFLTRPSLHHYIPDRATLFERASEVLGWVASGRLKVRIGGTYPLAEAAAAHRDLESRATTGKLLIVPD